ncbi:MAG: hypothetical protein KME60_15850 [Cyanomargarita calcarea GSE-NOS-MK-12-04C]|jgi:hypothetical protein|uniref:Uncharacterized protein n=1 Tax=Cyanomargarita calcarea GSE-NOS-MK-12-04C TaxID=2839659 RepID=A0A951UTK8_9CYAN|nr:hypothetical protein [Cyanomargarita calcarea GSE-NOS-MK-12-04C]
MYRKELAQKALKAERMHDVLLLIQNLANSEEATVKQIIDCLYDVGSVNLINKKFRFRPLNRMMILIARMSKPVFRVFAWHWFKNNCPQLIATWLDLKLSFEYPIAIPQPISLKTSEIQPFLPLEVDSLTREVKYLRRQVRWLAGISIVALSASGVAFTWLNKNLDLAPLESKQPIQSASKKIINNPISTKDCKSINSTNCER